MKWKKGENKEKVLCCFANNQNSNNSINTSSYETTSKSLEDYYTDNCNE